MSLTCIRTGTEDHQNFRPQDRMSDSLLPNGCLDSWTWNSVDKSCQVELSDYDPDRVIFKPSCQMFTLPHNSRPAVGIRGTKPLEHDRHYWEVKVTRNESEDLAIIGVGTAAANIHTYSIMCMADRIQTRQSWMLTSLGTTYHNGNTYPYTGAYLKDHETATIGVLLDREHGTMSYYKNGEPLGVAFWDMNCKNKVLYPLMMSARHAEMTLGKRLRNFPTLKGRCREIIVKELSDRTEVDRLPIPTQMKKYLIEDHAGYPGYVEDKKTDDGRRCTKKKNRRCCCCVLSPRSGMEVYLQSSLGLFCGHALPRSCQQFGDSSGVHPEIQNSSSWCTLA